MPEPTMLSNDSYPPNSVMAQNQKTVEGHEMKLKLCFGGEVLVLYINLPLTLKAFKSEIASACNFDSQQPFTVKWIDDEGDPCTISSQRELDEAVRLCEFNQDSELLIHVFPNVPLQPGLPCVGEDKHVYRRGARRWKKFYRVNGHLFQPKRFNKKALCAFCGDRVWGLGRQGCRCVQCKLTVHKRCHKFTKHQCSGQYEPGVTARPYNAEQRGIEHQSSCSLPTEIGAHTKHIYQNGDHSRSERPLSDGGAGGVHINYGLESLESGEESLVQPAIVANDFTGPTIKAAEGPSVSLDDFNLLHVIGRGSYAKVLQVELKTTKQIYAMKIIKKEIVTDDEDIDWVQTEKHVFEIASNHPFLVGLHSCFQTPSRLIFVIEFVPGGDLMFHMQTQRRLPEDHARFYSSEIILALSFLHRRGVIYRDLKLDNVLIDFDGHVKLTDYGMCKEGMGINDTTSTFCGTPNYIAPEILRGEEYSFSVDWWALGVLMYEMMAGRSPFDIVGAENNPDANTEDYLFQIILEKQIRIPRSLSVRASSVLKGFLNKNPLERLGCNKETGFEDIQSHPFFRSIDWVEVEAKQVVPPYKPAIKDERDLTLFDKLFTDEPPQLTPDESSVLTKIDQSEFEGFEYVNPLLMSREDTV